MARPSWPKLPVSLLCIGVFCLVVRGLVWTSGGEPAWRSSSPAPVLAAYSPGERTAVGPGLTHVSDWHNAGSAAKNVLAGTDLPFRYRLIDRACPRFLVAEYHPKAGLGHKVSHFVFSMMVAQLANLTFVADTKPFFAPGRHGEYRGAVEYIGLFHGEHTLESVRRSYGQLKRVECTFGSASFAVCTRPCSRLYVLPKGDTQYIWRRASHFYERAKWIMRFKYEAAAVHHYTPFGSSDVATVNVVWHLRMGDSSPLRKKPAFISTLSQKLDAIVNMVSPRFVVQHVFVGEDSMSAEQTRLPPIGFEYLASISNAVFVHNSTIVTSLSYFLNADVFVGGFSSLSDLVCLVATRPILFQTPDRRSSFQGYNVTDAVHVSNAGHILDLSEDALLARFALKLRKRVGLIKGLYK